MQPDSECLKEYFMVQASLQDVVIVQVNKPLEDSLQCGLVLLRSVETLRVAQSMVTNRYIYWRNANTLSILDALLRENRGRTTKSLTNDTR